MSRTDEPTPDDPLPPTTLYCDALARAGAGETVSLAPDEIAHARALRLSRGDAVLVTDGRGRRWEATLAEAGRRTVACRLREPRPASPLRPLVVWAPVGNRDRSLWLVEKAVELGVRRVVLVECARSRSVADAGRSAGFLARARRRAIAALTQSGGAHLPELEGPHELDALLETHGKSGSLGLLADSGGRPLLEVLDAPPSNEVTWLVGPEGGLTGPERERARTAGFELVGLGARTLRFETAALAGLAILAAALDVAGRDGGAVGPAAAVEGNAPRAEREAWGPGGGSAPAGRDR